MNSESVIFVVIAILFTIFIGDPDIHDAIITHLKK